MEWNIGLAAGICVAIMLHHMEVVKRLLRVQAVVSVLAKWYFTMKFALMLL